MWLKACLNGGRPAPATPAALAEAAAGAVAAGADALHIHPRDAAGRESLAAADIGAAVAAIRATCPGVPIGVSTGLWMTAGDPIRRRDLVAGWAALPAAPAAAGRSDPGAPAILAARPDFASVNASEAGFAELAELLGETGIGVEAGIWAPSEVDVLATVKPLRVLIEIIGTPAGSAVAAADAILRRLDEAGWTGPRLLHGEEEACWPLIAHAGRLGLDTRIGLEDTLTRPDGSPATDNADLVRLARQLWTDPGRGQRWRFK